MHQVKLPSVYGSLLMLGYNFLPLIYNELVAIQEHRDLLAHKVVRDGVMHSLDYYRAILVNVIALLLKAADLLSEGRHLHQFNIELPVGTSLMLSKVRVQFSTGICEPDLGLFQRGIRVKLAESLSSHDFHATLHMPLLIARTGIAETVGELVNGLHPQQCVSRPLTANKTGHGDTHVVIYHTLRDVPQVLEIPAVRLQKRLGVLTEEEICRTMVAVCQGEDRNIDLEAVTVYCQVHLAPVKLTITAGRIALANEALLKFIRIAKCHTDVVTH